MVIKSEHEIPAIFYEGYNREPRVKMELEQQLTPEFIEKLVQDDKMKYYRLEHIRMQLSYIHSKGFPVPKVPIIYFFDDRSLSRHKLEFLLLVGALKE